MEEEKLVKTIISLDKAYRDGAPLISDGAFDTLIEELRILNPNHPILLKSGRISHTFGTKGIKHLVYPIETIKRRIKAKNVQERSSLIPDTELTIEPKLDGASIIVYYIKGNLVMALTGSEEYEGIDITDNVRHTVPNQLPVPLTIAVGGEGIVSIEDFNSILQPLGYKNPRNAAVGIMKGESASKEVKNTLRFIACYTIGDNKDWNSQFPRQTLTGLGFEKVNNVKMSKSQFLNVCEKFTEKYPDLFVLRDGKTFLYDGLVIKDYRYNIKAVCGTWNLLEMNTEIAYKFTEDVVVTKIKAIDYNMTRLGFLVPTWVVDPIQVAGVTIGRMTASNVTYMRGEKAGSGIGATVGVIRANDVIPHLEDVITPSTDYRIPTKCPVCGTELIMKGVHLYCDNPLCAPKTVESIYRLFEVVMEENKLEGIGRTLIDDFLDVINVATFKEFAWACSFIHSATDFGIHNHFGPKTADKFVQVIDLMLNFVPTIEQVLYISNIPSFGKTVCEQYGQISIVDFIEVFINDMTIENWSKYSVNYLNQENLIKASPYVKEILKFFDCKLKEVEKTLAYAQLDWVVAVTGGVCMEREAWFKKLAQWGIKKGSVNKKTKYLVTNEQDNSNKLDKARQLGIEVITENDLYDKMGITEGDILK